MLKGPAGTRRTEKGPSGDFYDELQASRMSNCRSHRYTSDGENTVWRSMTKPFVTNLILFIIDVQLVQWRSSVHHSCKGHHHRWVMQVICDETLCSSMMFFVMMPDFIIEREGCRIVTADLWRNGNVHQKGIFYDSFGFVIRIFVIEVDISSSDMGLVYGKLLLQSNTSVSLLPLVV